MPCSAHSAHDAVEALEALLAQLERALVALEVAVVDGDPHAVDAELGEQRARRPSSKKRVSRRSKKPAERSGPSTAATAARIWLSVAG